MVRAEGFEPTQALRPSGFSYHLRLSPPPSGVCGLDYPFTLSRIASGDLGAARLVSTPSRTDAFRPGLARDCHFKGFPEFEQFCIPGFPESTQVWLKCVASTISPRPHAGAKV